MKKIIRASLSSNIKVTDRNWNSFLNKIEEATGLKVDSAYRRRRRGDDWIYLLDEDGNEFAAEITEYTDGEYEFLGYNLIKVDYPDSVTSSQITEDKLSIAQEISKIENELDSIVHRIRQLSKDPTASSDQKLRLLDTLLKVDEARSFLISGV